MNLRSIKVQTISLFIGAMILVVGCSIFVSHYSLNVYKEKQVEVQGAGVLENFKDELKSYLLIVEGMVQYYDGMSQGKSVEEVAFYKAQLADMLAKLRYRNKGYFYGIKKANTKSGYAYAFHGTSPERMDKVYVLDHKDPNGVDFRRQIVNNTPPSAEKGMFIQYMTRTRTPKIAFAKHYKNLDWIIVSGVTIKAIDTVKKAEVKKIDDFTTSMLSSITIYSSIIVVVIILLVSLVINRMVVRPLNELKDKAEDLATGDGDLTRSIEIKTEDEIGQASKKVNEFITKVRVIIQETKDLSSENSSVAHELSSTAIQVGGRVEDSTSLVSETTDISRVIQEEIKGSVQGAEGAKDEIIKANESLKEAKQEIAQMAINVEQAANTEVEMAQRIHGLSEDAEQVKGVLTVINDIADQTNLLALNAAIEAARAGDHGRGFAVVADEVRQLAERTQRSLTEINATINVIVQAVADSSEQMNENSEMIQQLTEYARNVESKIEKTATVMEEATNMNTRMIEDYIKTGQNIDSIVHKVEDVNTLSSENARSVEEIAAAAEHLNAMTEKLNNTLSQFRT